MRGKATGTAAGIRLDGITPAYAGKRCQKSLVFFPQRDHPRLCGEKAYKATQNDFDKGSPPPMRGKAMTKSHLVTSCGITPAYAGKSAARNIKSSGGWDHPRLCGEKAL